MSSSRVLGWRCRAVWPLARSSTRARSDAGRPFERARTELAFGEFLRRARRRVEAREHLRAALDGFETLGAELCQHDLVAYPLVVLALIAAHRGDEDECRSLAAGLGAHAEGDFANAAARLRSALALEEAREDDQKLHEPPRQG